MVGAVTGFGRTGICRAHLSCGYIRVFIMVKTFVVMYVSTHTRKIIDEINWALMLEPGRVQALSSIS